ncbi:MAG: hypothetical protein WA783_17310 [Phormidesmis sp.]
MTFSKEDSDHQSRFDYLLYHSRIKQMVVLLVAITLLPTIAFTAKEDFTATQLICNPHLLTCKQRPLTSHPGPHYVRLPGDRSLLSPSPS